MFARFLLAPTIAAVVIFSAPLAANSSHINLISPLTVAAVLAALPARRSRRYLRKREVARRYGVDERTVDRMAKDGRLPAYIYLPGSKLPLQDEDELDARDNAAAAERTSRITKTATA
jgi:hypothetical protein